VELIPIPGARLYYNPHFLEIDEANDLFQTLLSKCAWVRRKAPFGNSVPRDEAYYGDPETSYRYSRREYNPLPWIPELLSLRSRVQAPLQRQPTPNNGKLPYNAVLCNLYRDGNDSVALHADAEPERGQSSPPSVLVQSVCLG
jgi:alkylated DNA repair dioxygenase AlkB